MNLENVLRKISVSKIMDFKSIAEANKILEIRVGSHLFGTNTLDSDLDLSGIFMPCEEMVYGFQNCEEVDLSIVSKDDTGRNTAEAVDQKYYEFRKFVRLAMQNNPNILHHLFVDEKNIVQSNDIGRRLLAKAEIFPTKGAHHRFVKYADSQRHKMQIKPENYAALEEGLEILRGMNNYVVMIELKDKKPFSCVGKERNIRLGDLTFSPRIPVRKAKCMIEDRLSKATNRVQLFTKYGFDVKFASNLIQLLMEGIELMNTGRIVMPLAYRQDILSIKNGKYPIEHIMTWADSLVEEARSAYETSKLPAEPRSKEIEAFVMFEVRNFLAIERCCVKT